MPFSKILEIHKIDNWLFKCLAAVFYTNRETDKVSGIT